MGINAVSGNGTFDYSYSANGQLCWVVSGTGASSNTCANPTGSTAWEGFTYDASGNRTATSANNGFGATSTLTWNQDTGTLGCINTSGTTCTTPSATAPATATYTYDADQLRMSATTWNASTSSTQTASFTWDTSSSALLSDGSFDYVYGLHANVPIAQIDPATSVTSQLLSDTTANVRGVLEVTSSAPSPFALANYTDYDPYGNPTTGADGSVNPGGLSTPSGTDVDSATRFGFGGGYLDPTALIYLVHRYYDPATGQFVSVDPMVGSIGTPFSYAGDNPVQYCDQLGDSTFDFTDGTPTPFISFGGTRFGQYWVPNSVLSGAVVVGKVVGAWWHTTRPLTLPGFVTGANSTLGRVGYAKVCSPGQFGYNFYSCSSSIKSYSIRLISLKFIGRNGHRYMQSYYQVTETVDVNVGVSSMYGYGSTDFVDGPAISEADQEIIDWFVPLFLSWIGQTIFGDKWDGTLDFYFNSSFLVSTGFSDNNVYHGIRAPCSR